MSQKISPVICDGCGKREPAVFYSQGDRRFHKPEDWYSRADEEGEQDACSRACVDAVFEKTGRKAKVPIW